jgi:RNA polymerase-binding transcription factor DksA
VNNPFLSSPPEDAARPPLTHDQRVGFAHALETRLAALVAERAQTLEGETPVLHARETRQTDADDAQARAGDREVEAAQADLGSSEFDELTAALARVHGPAYGVCSDCGVPIALKRLEAEPEALRCLVCETAYERAQKARL